MATATMRMTSDKRTDDVLERFFSWGEQSLCAPRSIQALAQEEVQDPDVLDYVFEHVESFTCVEEQQGQFLREAHTFDTHGQNSLIRENSLVESGPTGSPQRLVTTRKQPTQPTVAPFGKEGDLLDYCFEHVESYVEAHACSEGNEVIRPKGKSKEQLALEDRAQAAIEHQVALQQRTASAIKEQDNKKKWLRSAIVRRAEFQRQRHPEISHPIPTEISTRNKKGETQQNYYLEPEEEESIMLYYRPQKRH